MYRTTLMPLLADPFEDGLPTLDAERLRLRAVRPEEASDVLRVFGNPVAMEYWSHGPLPDLAAARDYVTNIHEGWRDRVFYQWAIARRQDDAFLGTVTLCEWDRGNRHAELGYMLDPAVHGQGLASEAVRTVLRFGFETMELHRVEADTDPRNAASIRLLERLGFQREGYFRERWLINGEWLDSVMFGLLHADFRG